MLTSRYFQNASFPLSICHPAIWSGNDAAKIIESWEWNIHRLSKFV
jgi:hypothetical protein